MNAHVYIYFQTEPNIRHCVDMTFFENKLGSCLMFTLVLKVNLDLDIMLTLVLKVKIDIDENSSLFLNRIFQIFSLKIIQLAHNISTYFFNYQAPLKIHIQSILDNNFRNIVWLFDKVFLYVHSWYFHTIAPAPPPPHDHSQVKLNINI